MKEFEARRPELRVADAFRAESHGVVADDIGARLQILLAAIRLPQALRQPWRPICPAGQLLRFE